MLIAVTRPVSPSLTQCELTHLAREPIDVARATAQHAAYELLLSSLGARIVRVPAAPELPDAVFIEDTAFVLDEVAIVTRPGAPSRRAESAAVASVLSAYRPVHSMEAPATLDGGDVLRLGRTLHVGRSSRTNEHGIEQLRSLVAPFAYRGGPGRVQGMSAPEERGHRSYGRRVADEHGLGRSGNIPACKVLPVDDREPHAANALRIADTIVLPSQYPRTFDRLIEHGLRVATTDCSEITKAEGAVTCCSLVFDGIASSSVRLGGPMPIAPSHE